MWKRLKLVACTSTAIQNVPLQATLPVRCQASGFCLLNDRHSALHQTGTYIQRDDKRPPAVAIHHHHLVERETESVFAPQTWSSSTSVTSVHHVHWCRDYHQHRKVSGAITVDSVSQSMSQVCANKVMVLKDQLTSLSLQLGSNPRLPRLLVSVSLPAVRGKSCIHPNTEWPQRRFQDSFWINSDRGRRPHKDDTGAQCKRVCAFSETGSKMKFSS